MGMKSGHKDPITGFYNFYSYREYQNFCTKYIEGIGENMEATYFIFVDTETMRRKQSIVIKFQSTLLPH